MVARPAADSSAWKCPGEARETALLCFSKCSTEADEVHRAAAPKQLEMTTETENGLECE